MLSHLIAAAVMSAMAPQCPLPQQAPMLVTQMFFGRDIAGRGPLTDREWGGFVAGTIAKNFPDGFTVEDGEGQWLDPKTHRMSHERSKVVIVAAPSTPDLTQRIKAVMSAYRAQFHQQSVGILTATECGSF
jgi:hypothetical protein